MELQQNLNLTTRILKKLWDYNTFVGKILSLILNGSNNPIFQICRDRTIFR